MAPVVSFFLYSEVGISGLSSSEAFLISVTTSRYRSTQNTSRLSTQRTYLAARSLQDEPGRCKVPPIPMREFTHCNNSAAGRGPKAERCAPCKTFRKHLHDTSIINFRHRARSSLCSRNPRLKPQSRKWEEHVRGGAYSQIFVADSRSRVRVFRSRLRSRSLHPSRRCPRPFPP